MKATLVNLSVNIASCVPEYRTHLRAGGRTTGTVDLYLDELRKLERYLTAQGMPTDVAAVRREHIEAYLVSMVDRGCKPATVSLAFRSLNPFWKWLEEEGEVQRSPMSRMKAPIVPVDPVPVLREAQMEDLLATCKSASFEDRRDAAILLLLYGTGMRRGELVNLTLGDVDMDQSTVSVRGKGRVLRIVPFGAQEGKALGRYLRLRGRHPSARLDAFWLGTRGALGGSGVLQMFKRRGRLIGVPELHPHQLRHTFAHTMKASGTIGDEDIMRLAGWKSHSMLQRYGASAADERARAAYTSPAAKLKLR